MVAQKLTESDFIAEYKALGPHGLARKHNLAVRSVYTRRRNIEIKTKVPLNGPMRPQLHASVAEYPGRLELSARDCTVLVASDCHYWPDAPSTAHRAFVKMIKELGPRVVVLNGDVLDGATISRHPPINWEKRPSLIQEIEVCKERLYEIEQAAGKAEKIWALGNHCARFESRLASIAPEYANVHGMHLKDHFPYWRPCWSVWFNSDTVIKHRFKGGIHSTHNATMWAGKTMVNGHLHSLKVTPFTDYDGTRWGVDTGTLADPWAPAFEYMEDNPRNWRAGFAVLTFHEGELLWPELVSVRDRASVVFRGRVIDV